MGDDGEKPGCSKDLTTKMQYLRTSADKNTEQVEVEEETRSGGPEGGGKSIGQTKVAKDAESSDSEWEESIVYFELSDINSIGQFYRTTGPRDEPPSPQPKKNLSKVPKEKKTVRGGYTRCFDGKPLIIQPPPKKPIEKKQIPSYATEEKELTFHNLLTNEPILEFNGRYYAGRYAEMLGTGLAFREKAETAVDPLQDEKIPKEGEDAGAGTSKLKNLTSGSVEPPIDSLFGGHFVPEEGDPEFELVAKCTKIVRAQRMDIAKVKEAVVGQARAGQKPGAEAGGSKKAGAAKPKPAGGKAKKV